MHESALEERFLRDTPITRLVNLAANLSRIAKTTPSMGNWSSVLRDVREGKYFIEWTALDSPPELFETLREIQRRLCMIEQAGPARWCSAASDPIRAEVRRWSDELVAVYLKHQEQKA